MQEKRWIYKNEKIDSAQIDDMARQYKIPTAIAAIALNRNIKTEDQMKAYLSKSIGCIHNPMQMKDADKATKRIKLAIENKEKIVIYGDYDVDGITSTSLLYLFLKSQNADVDYYIPDRMEEGYGINIMAINKIIKSKANLLITVDCGITAVGEVEFAKLAGLDIIITDHHTCKEKIPDALAVINPKQEDCGYPFSELAGVGVAFKLILALCIELGMNTKECFWKYCDIVSIGTIADVVPLLDENRIIVDKGLEVLGKNNRIGLKALFEKAGIGDKPITVSNIAFAVSPRLNAAGRLGTAATAVKLLLTQDEDEAFKIATELDEENRKRQLTEQQIFAEAMEMIESDADFDKKMVIVLCKEDWHHGVIGIVASRICERFYKPCILVTKEGKMCKGSGRSISGFNLFDALTHCGDLLTNFGGHAIAAGLGLSFEDLDEFTAKINEYAKANLSKEDMIPRVEIDYKISADNVALESVELLSRLEPFGVGNPKPVFSICGLRISAIGQMGMDNKHLRMRLSTDNRTLNAVGFGMGDAFNSYKVGDIIDVAFSMEINSFQGNNSVQLLLKDIKRA